MESNLNKINSSSIYKRRVEELFKILNQDDDEKKYKNDDELYISYDYSDLSNKNYFFRYKNNDSVIGLSEMRKKNPYWEDFNKIFIKLQLAEKGYHKLKNIDPNLMEIIYNEKGENAVYVYLEQLKKGKLADKSKLPYKMRYDLTSVMKNKELSFSNKRSIIKMIRKNKHVANVDYKNTIGKRVAAMFAAIGLLFSTVPKLNDGNVIVKNDNSNSHNSVLNTIETENGAKIEETTKTNQAYILSKEEKSRILSQTKEFLERHNQNKAKRNKEIEFGTLMQLPEGTQFMEGVSGGRKGMIGDEASPSTGIYVIDYYAEVSEDGVTSVHSLEGKIDNNNSKAKQFVHLSFVKGATNIEEAKSIIEQEKESMQNGGVDTKKIQPRGWVSKDTVQELYNMQQKNTQKLDNER